MDSNTYQRLVAVMAQLGGGDSAAMFCLYREFGGHLAAVMRRQLRHLGVTHIEPDELDELVIDACLALFDCAGAWRPDGGALPWTWAGRRLAAVASAWVGQHADALDAERHDLEAGVAGVAGPAEQPQPVGSEADELEVLGRLAACHDGCALLLEALELVVPARDRAILLELRTQAAEGDPSPARTVAGRHGISPDAVRQAASRARRRLRELAAGDPRFAPLVDLPLVA